MIMRIPIGPISIMENGVIALYAIKYSDSLPKNKRSPIAVNIIPKAQNISIFFKKLPPYCNTSKGNLIKG